MRKFSWNPARNSVMFLKETEEPSMMAGTRTLEVSHVFPMKSQYE